MKRTIMFNLLHMSRSLPSTTDVAEMMMMITTKVLPEICVALALLDALVQIFVVKIFVLIDLQTPVFKVAINALLHLLLKTELLPLLFVAKLVSTLTFAAEQDEYAILPSVRKDFQLELDGHTLLHLQI
jgi:hypothetical protein